MHIKYSGRRDAIFVFSVQQRHKYIYHIQNEIYRMLSDNTKYRAAVPFLCYHMHNIHSGADIEMSEHQSRCLYSATYSATILYTASWPYHRMVGFIR